jgi:hypothetical protein
MPLSVITRTAQQHLAALCRTGEYHPVDGVSRERAEVYRSLVQKIFDDALRRAYPVACRNLGEDRWSGMVAEFMAAYPSQNPELWRMPEGLAVWARESQYGRRIGVRWLDDLLTFEWTEIEVFMMEDRSRAFDSLEGDPAIDSPVVNPEHRLLSLEYPVFRLSGVELDSARDHFFLSVFRHPETLAARFVELAPIYALTLEILSREEAPVSGFEALHAAARLLDFDWSEEFVRAARGFFEHMIRERLLLGYRKGKNPC